MRKKGAVSQCSAERDKDLYAQYKKLVEEQLHLYGRVCKAYVLKKLVSLPAKR